MTQRKYFGTDGIRGRVGAAIINPEFVLKLGWAAGKALQTQEKSKILIGKDTRISGYILESVLEAGFTAAGVDVLLLGPMPTPAIAYLTRTFRAAAGIVISASHNPYYDNGIKFFSTYGTKISDAVELAIEEYIAQPMRIVEPIALGKAKRMTDAPGRYIEFCKSTLGLNSSLTGLKIVIDCANGATYQVAPAVFQELGAEVIATSVHPNGLNINDNCGSTCPQQLAHLVVAEQADLGIAFDGDGDRVIMVDHTGEVVDGDELLFIIAKHAFDNNKLAGGIVGTEMSNLGLEISLRDLGIGFKRSKVGDRYVIEALQAHDWLLGGEASGHIVHLGLTTSGDGIVSALQVLGAMCNTGKALRELKNNMLKFPQVLINVTVNDKKICTADKLQRSIEAVTAKLGQHGRVLVRPSGTEPVIRVMVEGEDLNRIQAGATELEGVIKELAAKKNA